MSIYALPYTMDKYANAYTKKIYVFAYINFARQTPATRGDGPVAAAKLTWLTGR
jgi:hypothetical protein